MVGPQILYTSPNMYDDKTLVIIASDLVHAEEHFGS
jgi:hypothetical protein